MNPAIRALFIAVLVLACSKPHDEPDPIYPATLHDEDGPAEARVRHDLIAASCSTTRTRGRGADPKGSTWACGASRKTISRTS